MTNDRRILNIRAAVALTTARRLPMATANKADIEKEIQSEFSSTFTLPFFFLNHGMVGF